MRWDRFIIIMIVMVATLLLISSCKIKKGVIIDESNKTDTSITTNTNNSLETNIEQRRDVSDSVYIFIVDSIGKDSAGVIHHWHTNRIYQIVKEYNKAKSDTIRLVTVKNDTIVISESNKDKVEKIIKNTNTGWYVVILASLILIGVFIWRMMRK